MQHVFLSFLGNQRSGKLWPETPRWVQEVRDDEGAREAGAPEENEWRRPEEGGAALRGDEEETCQPSQS